MKVAEQPLFWQTITGVQPEAEGYVITLSCEHESWSVIPPGGDGQYCAQCLHEWMEKRLFEKADSGVRPIDHFKGRGK